MYRILLLLTAVFFTAGIYAQTPDALSYQTVIRNSSNQLVINHDIGIKISILQGSVTGTAVYTETHSSSTNANGVASLEVGKGTTSDDFTVIDWSNGPYFIKSEIDPETAGGSNYTITGTSELLSVPFAHYAKVAEKIAGSQTVMLRYEIANAPDTVIAIGDLEFRYNTNVPGGFLEMRTISGNATMQVYGTKRKSTSTTTSILDIENYHNVNTFTTDWSAILQNWTGTDYSGRVILDGAYVEFEGTLFPTTDHEVPFSFYRFYITIDGYNYIVIKVDYNK
jgi:hypothetical protein